MKKILAISVLSLGFLSLAPSALCTSGDANNTNGTNIKRSKLGFNDIMIPALYLRRTDFEKFLEVSEKTKSRRKLFKVNPVGISSLGGIIKFVPKIETFEDHHTLMPDEDRGANVNKFVCHIKTLIYYPGSFDVERFNTILKINGIEEDLRDANEIIETNSISNQKTVHLYGNEWECIVHPFNGRNYRIEYIKNYQRRSQRNKRRIVFIFSPSNLVNLAAGSFVDSFNKLLDCCDLRMRLLINVKNTLKTFTVPTNVTKIGPCAFNGCEFLEKIKIPEGVEKIDRCAFGGCKSLKEIEIPNSVTEIGTDVFGECTSLEKIKMSENVTSIGSGAFLRCKSLKEIEIPNGVTSIDGGTFIECESLEKIKIPESVTLIDGSAFFRCKSLKEIEIPNSVTSIHKNAFNGCTSLKEIIWNGNTYGVKEFFEAFNNRS